MIELIEMEYPSLNTLREIRDMILIEFNRNIKLDHLNSLLYGDEDYEIESNKVEFYKAYSL